LKEKWLLRTIPHEDVAIAIWVDEEGRVSFEKRDVLYPLYLLSFKEEKTAALREDLENVEGIYEVSIEEWLSPPWYERKVKLLKVTSKNLLFLQRLGKELENKGLAQPVNTQPGSLLLGLREHGLKACYWSSEKNNEITYHVPPLRVLQVVMRDRKLVFTLYELGSREAVSWEAGSYDYPVDYIDNSHVIIDYNNVIPTRLAGWRPVIRVNRNPVDNIYGLIELCRLSCMDLERVSRSSIGEILTTIEAFRAVEKKMLVPKARMGGDTWRDMDSLLFTDKGGLIGSPRPGLYLNVAQLDFSSLYPSIIATHNISPETLNKPECTNIHRPFGSPHMVCLDKPGLVATVLRELVNRRESIKKLGDKTSSYREKAIKWILVASFGYLGYRNSRFGNIYAYETVTWVAREVLKRAITAAEESGYRVIHFIVDSLFISKNSEKIEKEELSRLIEKLSIITGFKIKIENMYKWLIIPRTNHVYMERGATNRYYGLTLDGKLIVKGSICGWSEALLSDPDKEEELISFLSSHKHPRKLCKDILGNAARLGLDIRYEE